MSATPQNNLYAKEAYCGVAYSATYISYVTRVKWADRGLEARASRCLPSTESPRGLFSASPPEALQGHPHSTVGPRARLLQNGPSLDVAPSLPFGWSTEHPEGPGPAVTWPRQTPQTPHTPSGTSRPSATGKTLWVSGAGG